MSDTESESTPDVPLVSSDTADHAAPTSSEADVPPGFPLESSAPSAPAEGDADEAEATSEDDPQGSKDPLSVGTTEADVSDGEEQQDERA